MQELASARGWLVDSYLLCVALGLGFAAGTDVG